ncbi:hypothetical protein HLB23_37110 [Nocardia uniformis]|uniref:Uncharacterized protein n=1 Tax=Nocardia uniformis TaxID=53432 RepID=A0A849CC15_9NOCA|nr:hypothetical protein [Nocardia uniformis]NNH75406.1 hypothetical protein [Nocardia uniformis]
MHTLLSNLGDLAQVVLAALIFGAGLPTIFAFGIHFRARADDAGPDGGAVRTATLAVSTLCFAVVMAAVVIGVLFIAKGFLASRLGIHIFGA